MSGRLHRLLARAREEQGYSLLELLTALTIFILVLTGITTLFVRATTAEADLHNRSQAQQSARIALDRFRKEAHCASGSTQLGPSDVTLLMPPQCPYGANVTYCMVKPNPAVDRAKLYRQVGDTCDATAGKLMADYFTTATSPPSKFTSVPSGPGTLASVGVDFHVNREPAKPLQSYDLVDAIVLRNSVRG